MNVAGALFFIISTLLTLYSFCILARIILQVVRADFYNPVCQFVVKATNPFLRPMHRFIPIRPVDFSAIFLLLVVQSLVVCFESILKGIALDPTFVVVNSVIQSIRLVLDFFVFTIFVQVILSWVQPGGYNPMIALLHQLTEPLLAPVRRILPDMGGLDLSPMVVLMGLYALSILFPVLQ